jgi:hypothetical protein
MGKTYRKEIGRGTQKNEPYKKRVKNENLDMYKGYSSGDFEEEDDDCDFDVLIDK